MRINEPGRSKRAVFCYSQEPGDKKVNSVLEASQLYAPQTKIFNGSTGPLPRGPTKPDSGDVAHRGLGASRVQFHVEPDVIDTGPEDSPLRCHAPSGTWIVLDRDANTERAWA
jgi:hypothetical protein